MAGPVVDMKRVLKPIARPVVAVARRVGAMTHPIFRHITWSKPYCASMSFLLMVIATICAHVCMLCWDKATEIKSRQEGQSAT
jgi:hypothetical protein